MLAMKRLTVWLVEVALEAVLLGSFLVAIFGHDRHSLGKDLLISAVAITWMFFVTGYLLTTALSRFFWKLPRLWPYSAFAAVLFLIHFEFLNVGVGGAFAPSDRLRIRVAGILIVLACTLGGSLVIRLWEAQVPRLSSPEEGETTATASL